MGGTKFLWISLALFLAPAFLHADELSPAMEQWRSVPMPARFHVEPTALEGPVFADEEGRTLYKWPQHKLRNGYSGEAPGIPACFDEVLTVTAGLMSPYPPGIKLPEPDQRPACTGLWPPVYASEDAQAIGEWSILERPDGRRQWAYEEQPLYTSVRDKNPGDVLGGTSRKRNGDSPAFRSPVGPPPMVPPGFRVKTTIVGRMLTGDDNYALYAFDGDSATEIGCTGDCLSRWEPVLAPALVRPAGEWSLLERSPGVFQWVYRGKPLYRHTLDTHQWSQEGSDAPGWSNVFTQRMPAPPAEFTQRDTIAGTVLADSRGHTIYIYRCGEDSADQLACDHPMDTQVYRLAICGGGDPGQCQARWPYVNAPANAPTRGVWSGVLINPATGKFAEDGSANAMRVWAYRDRPVYTYALDISPGDVHGSGIGEWRGKRNGLVAFWLRDDVMEGIE